MSASTPLSRRLLFALVPALVVLGGAELGLRSVGWPSPEAAFEHNEPFWVVDPVLRAHPMDHKEEGARFPVSTDENGLRAPLHPVDKAAGALRVMALGCSTTFGWGVADAESYPARLEARGRAAGFPKLEVINGGQPGYTSFQGLWLWGRTLEDYAPDVVLIGYIVQDARRAAYSDRSQAILQQDARFLKDNLLYRSRVYLGLRSLLGGVQVRAKERTADGDSGEHRVPLAEYDENLRTLVSRVQAIGAKPVLFGYPLERAGYTAAHRAQLAATAEALGVPAFDPQPQMDVAARTELLYFPNDRGHANAAGNDRIAEWVLGFLSAQTLLEGAR